jgi:Protein of unknown function (DUF5672)
MPTLSVSCIETRNYDKAARAVQSTVRCIPINCVYWFSNAAPPFVLSGIEIIHVAIPHFTDFEDINRITLRLMPQVVTTDYTLVVQADGFAVNGQAWDPLFLEYDYVGAPWPWMWGGGPYWARPFVGNGGFSLRSRRLLSALRELEICWHMSHWADDERLNLREHYGLSVHGDRFLPEDLLICLWYRELLEEKYGIRFCPPELANKFSVETVHPFTQYWLGRSFGFHGAVAAPHYNVSL